MSRHLLWFRNDLRCHDNRLLAAACENADTLLPVYVVDPAQWADHPLGFPRTGPFRSRFLHESLLDLNQQLIERGSGLLVVAGAPAAVLTELCNTYRITQVYASEETGTEEADTLKAVKQALDIPVHTERQSSLVDWADFPFHVLDTPDSFTGFRKKVEKHWKIHDPVPAPTRLPPPPAAMPEPAPAEWPSELTPDCPDRPDDWAIQLKGGETAGLARLAHYLWEADCLKAYKKTRNGLVGMDYSSKFSPWLANGCLSPRQIVADIKRYEAERTKNDSTYWLVFELLWRDYFKAVFEKYGARFFYGQGLRDHPVPWKQDEALFHTWVAGDTGYPFVDANMKELAATGFMSNRGRQNVASFLTKALGIDWRWGAAYFESLLIDYDVSSNWGNWAYNAGVGNDLRENRLFNVMKQGNQYDKGGAYTRYWLPELANIPDHGLFAPFQLGTGELNRHGLAQDSPYRQPVVSTQVFFSR